uniref:Uncharacterized protein n=1 Tax=Arundo donax TaxID=35708 RepID=A0A0A9AFP6_ARUDO
MVSNSSTATTHNRTSGKRMNFMSQLSKSSVR